MRASFIALLAACLLSACGERPPIAYGDPNSIIVLAQEELWREVEDSLEAALEPRIFTVREERMFLVTHVAPAEPRWGTLRSFRQILVIGRPGDPWIQEVAEESSQPIATPPTVIEARNVWVNGQIVTAAVVPPGREISGLYELLPRLHELFDERFRTYARQRMFASGADTALADTLRRQAGFSLVLPEVYRRLTADSMYLFRNDVLATGEQDLVRSILVTWRGGPPRPLTTAEVLDWRERVVRRYYDRPMVTVTESVRSDTVRTAAGPALEVQGVWQAPPGEWPGAGPFIDRIAYCPRQNRTYYLDAWLYAPGRAKYEYMIQLRTILDSFQCGGSR